MGLHPSSLAIKWPNSPSKYPATLMRFSCTDELNDPVPYFRSNMISRRLDELEDGVDVPFILVKK
jgi:hypothetical protein